MDMVSVCDGWMGVGMAVPLGAPDALVQAGSARFAAHARLLAAHSGYFKSVLGTRRDAVLYVPNVSAQQFWPLLAYMYTGYLDLSQDNIYQVLLATHLLHMPRALDLCRNFLAQTRPLPPTIVKPIPSRKLPPFLSSSNVFRPLGADTLALPSPVNETSFRTPEAFGDGDPAVQDLKLPAAAEECSTAKEIEFSHDSGSSYISVGNDPRKLGEMASLKNDKIAVGGEPSVDSDAEVREEVKLKNKTDEIVQNKMSLRNDDKVVIDVACCDGPVRFHRVLNRAYKSNCPERFKDVAELTDSDDSYIEIEEDTRSKGGESLPYDNCNAFSKSLQKQMTENIKLHNENRPNENIGGETSQSVTESGSNRDQTSNQQQETIYTCVYCNHTFKSQYCYQKHARRHLNPVSIDAVNQEGLEGCYKTRPITQKIQAAGPRREVRLLDMNVQYYPCKTCGSKFPSYYFVHKHRKMCHAEELEGSEGNVKGGSSIPDKKRKISTNNKDPKATPDKNDGNSKIDV